MSFDLGLTEVNINGAEVQAAREHTSQEVAERYLEAVQPFLDIIGLKEEKIDGFVDTVGVIRTGEVIPILDQIDALNTHHNHDDKVQQGIRDLIELLLVGNTQPTIDGTDTKRMNVEMVVALDQLLQSLKAVGVEINLDAIKQGIDLGFNFDFVINSINPPPIPYISSIQLIEWKNTQGIADVFTDIAKKIEHAGIAAPHSLQALIELVYVKTGNEVMSEALEELEEALATTKDVLDTLTDIQTLHNKIDITIHPTNEDVSPVDFVIPADSDGFRISAEFIPGSAFYKIDSATIIGSVPPQDQILMLDSLIPRIRNVVEKVRLDIATTEELEVYNEFTGQAASYLSMINSFLNGTITNPLPDLFDADGNLVESAPTFDPSDEMLEYFLAFLARRGTSYDPDNFSINGILNSAALQGEPTLIEGLRQLVIANTFGLDDALQNIDQLAPPGGVLQFLLDDIRDPLSFANFASPDFEIVPGTTGTNGRYLSFLSAMSSNVSGITVKNFQDLQGLVRLGYIKDTFPLQLPWQYAVHSATFDETLRLHIDPGAEPEEGFFQNSIYDPLIGPFNPNSPLFSVTVDNLLTKDWTDSEKEKVMALVRENLRTISKIIEVGGGIPDYDRFAQGIQTLLFLAMHHLPQDPNTPLPPIPLPDLTSLNGEISTLNISPLFGTILRDLEPNWNSLDGNDITGYVFPGGVSAPDRIANFNFVAENMTFEDLQGIAFLSHAIHDNTGTLLTEPVNKNDALVPPILIPVRTWDGLLVGLWGYPSVADLDFHLANNTSPSFEDSIQGLDETYDRPIVPVTNRTLEDVSAFERVRREINEQIIALEGTTPTDEEGRVDQESLLSKLKVLKQDIDAAFANGDGTEKTAGEALDQWILDRYNVVDSEEAGIIQRNITNAIVAAESLNDSQKSRVRRFLFVFEEYYKSSAAILQKITQLIERIAQGIAR